MKFVLFDVSVMVVLFDDVDIYYELYVIKIGVLMGCFVLVMIWLCVIEVSYIFLLCNYLVLLYWLKQGVVEVVGFEVVDLELMMNWMKGYIEVCKILMDLVDVLLVWFGDWFDSMQIFIED